MTDIIVSLECHDNTPLLTIYNAHDVLFNAIVTGGYNVGVRPGVTTDIPLTVAGTYTVSGTFSDGATPIYPNGQTVTLTTGALAQCHSLITVPQSTTVAMPTTTMPFPTLPTTAPVLTLPVLPSTIVIATSTLQNPTTNSIAMSTKATTTTLAHTVPSFLPTTGASNSPLLIGGTFILGVGILVTMIGRYCNRRGV